jgi:CheY-like chemotaxis protein
MAHKGKMGRSPWEEQLLVKIKPELTGKDLIKAAAQQDPGGWQVNFELNSTGGEIFRKVTRANIDNRLAIVLDKKLISAPSINSEIGSRGVITGDFDYREAVDLANSLENPLETPVKIVKVFSVDPSLGADSVRSGFTSGIIALLLVILFMGIYYLRAGVIADVVLPKTKELELKGSPSAAPELNGIELARRIVALRPQTRVIFISGHPRETGKLHRGGQPEAAFLQKPFDPDSLSRKVREVLEAPGP